MFNNLNVSSYSPSLRRQYHVSSPKGFFKRTLPSIAAPAASISRPFRLPAERARTGHTYPLPRPGFFQDLPNVASGTLCMVVRP